MTRTHAGVVGTLVVALLLMCGFSCNAVPWLTLAEQDIPALTAQAQNIIKLVDPADSALAASVSSGVLASVTLVSDAVAAYNQNPTAATLQKVVAALNRASADIPNVLASVQFTNGTDLLIVTAAVDVIVTTIDSIAVQIGGGTTMARKARLQKAKLRRIPTASDLRANWNLNVCGLAPERCPSM